MSSPNILSPFFSHTCSHTYRFIVKFLPEVEFSRNSLKAFKQKNQFLLLLFWSFCLLPSLSFRVLLYGVQGHTFGFPSWQSQCALKVSKGYAHLFLFSLRISQRMHPGFSSIHHTVLSKLPFGWNLDIELGCASLSLLDPSHCSVPSQPSCWSQKIMWFFDDHKCVYQPGITLFILMK